MEKELKAIVEDEELVESLVKLAREKFAEAKPENHDALQAAGLVALGGQVVRCGRRAIGTGDQGQARRQGRGLLVWGLELFLAEKFAEAAEVFQRGIDEKALPESNPAFYFYLAGALAMDGKTDEALAAARTAAEKKPDDPRFESRVAWIYYHAKRYDEAAKHYRELMRKYDSELTTSPEVRTVRSRHATDPFQHRGSARTSCRRRKNGSSRCSTSFPTTSGR